MPAYAPFSAPHVFVDPHGLQQLFDRCSAAGTRVALIGYNEYSKHLINLCGANVVCIYDPHDHNIGIHFRGIPVVDMPTKLDANLLACCDYKYLYEYGAKLEQFYDNVVFFYPSRLDSKETTIINVFEQEEFYRHVLSNREMQPVSMMNVDKLQFLLEMLRLGLSYQGSVVEIGAWQGGSAWLMAKSMNYLSDKRHLYMLDLFETLADHEIATVCNDEVKSRFSFYPDAEMIVGLADDPQNLERIKGPICFAHMDLGPLPVAMEYVWNRMPIGAPILLDNYSEIGAPPWRFDNFFAGKGARVNRLPWSGQAFVLKR